ncbi:hypothetical protein DP73_15520 [Desulfosporosinus sp. HMP52]|uniref:DUF6323 family protein n=1 Tax=Desulfosporosinus sp. HMP52 TaxID=1487923 RepID=UPI00051FAF61|nr:DUF6323 family protein [Desulfosporosinus sp. HMP52]KGK86834.1 hypothetical protein DP73_15520 [Desulfosporosinus sp. HMP52]
MGSELSLFSGALVEKQAVNEVMKCNDLTVKFGLVLTEVQALALVATRSFALKENGRIEFGGGVIDKIIKEFCNSPYLSRHNYEDTMHELLEIFYYYKNETLDLMGDDDLIKYMKNAFNGTCQGSLELLSGRELYKLARNLRYGYALDYSDDVIQLDNDEEDEYGRY